MTRHSRSDLYTMRRIAAEQALRVRDAVERELFRLVILEIDRELARRGHAS